jgi:hypothetical protein
LYFYVFSAGGGTGAGMASEFGAAQQVAFRTRALERKRNGTQAQKTIAESKAGDPRLLGLDFVFSAGMAILPYGTNSSDRSNQSNQTNAGRVLVRYFAQLWSARDESDEAFSIRQPR